VVACGIFEKLMAFNNIMWCIYYLRRVISGYMDVDVHRDVYFEFWSVKLSTVGAVCLTTMDEFGREKTLSAQNGDFPRATCGR